MTCENTLIIRIDGLRFKPLNEMKRALTVSISVQKTLNNQNPLWVAMPSREFDNGEWFYTMATPLDKRGKKIHAYANYIQFNHLSCVMHEADPGCKLQRPLSIVIKVLELQLNYTIGEDALFFALKEQGCLRIGEVILYARAFLSNKWKPLLTPRYTDSPRKFKTCYGITQAKVAKSTDFTRLGAGTYGEVFEYHGTKQPRVAIKFSQLSKESYLETAVEEAQSLQLLDHPSIVKMFAATNEGSHFVHYLELARGKPAYDWFGKMKDGKACQVLVVLLQAIYYMHQRGVGHLDISGGNVIISKDTEVKIIDFGFAVRYDPQFPALKDQFTGTYVFMPPEALKRNSKIHPEKVDLWSVCILVLQLIVGKLHKQYFSKTKEECYAYFANFFAVDLQYAHLPKIENPLLRRCLAKGLSVNPRVRPTALELLRELTTMPFFWPQLPLLAVESWLENLLLGIQFYETLPASIRLLWTFAIENETNNEHKSLCDQLYLAFERKQILGLSVKSQGLPRKLEPFLEMLTSLGLEGGHATYRDLCTIMAVSPVYNHENREFLWQRVRGDEPCKETLDLQQMQKFLKGTTIDLDQVQFLFIYADNKMEFSKEAFFELLDCVQTVTETIYI